MAIHKKLFFLLLFFLPSQLGFHFWPEWSYVLGRRIDYLSPTLYFTDVLIVCMFIAWAFVHRQRLRIPQGILTWAFIFLGFLFMAVNILGAANISVSIYMWLKVIEYAGFCWYIIVEKIRMRDAIFPLALSVGYSSMIGIGQFIFQHSLGGPFWIIGERSFFSDTPGIARFNLCPSYTCTLVLRAYGTFPHPNVLGGYIAVVSPIIGYFLITSPFKHSRLYSIILFVSFAALLVTFSRSAWVVAFLHFSILIGIVLNGIKKNIHWLNRIGTMLALCALVIACVVFFPTASDESVVRRIELQESAIRMWKHSSVFGVGLGNFVSQLPTYTHNRYINFLQPVHNIFFLWLAELGVVGLFMVAAMCGAILKYSYALFSRATEMKRHEYLIYLIPLLSLIIVGGIDHYPVTLQQGQLLSTLFIGMYISLVLK